jgi:2-iminobutanoate/2-iminopropanoate deaminase
VHRSCQQHQCGASDCQLEAHIDRCVLTPKIKGDFMREIISPSNAPKPRGVYSPAVTANGFVFVSGQAAVNPENNELELGDVKSETRRTLGNIQAILEASGSSLNEIVRIGVFLADIRDFDALNEVFKEFFPANPPARTTVGAQLPKIKIEIDCIARVK